jgi:hypothetical protein
MLVLPTGQIFVAFCGLTGTPQIYSPSESPNPAWAPRISSIPSTLTAGGTFLITGTQFNGLSQGAMYGDNAILLRLSRVNVYLRLPSSSASGIAWTRKHHRSRPRERGSGGVAEQSDPMHVSGGNAKSLDWQPITHRSVVPSSIHRARSPNTRHSDSSAQLGSNWSTDLGGSCHTHRAFNSPFARRRESCGMTRDSGSVGIPLAAKKYRAK